MVLDALGASLLGNILVGKDTIRAGKGKKKAGEGTIRAGENFDAVSSFN